MWYDDLLLVMLLVVLALLVFTAILVSTKIRKPNKKVGDNQEITGQTPSTEVTPESASRTTKETVYEKLYSEHEKENSIANSIDAQPPILEEDNTQKGIETELDLNPNMDKDLDEYDELDEWENGYTNTLDIQPQVLNLEDESQKELVQPKVNVNSEELVDENDYKVEADQNPGLDSLKEDGLFFDYGEDIEDEVSQEEAGYFFNLKPQPLEDLTDKENHILELDDSQKKLELEPSISTATINDSSMENKKPEEKRELGVTICPHCNAKVPATLYCIICGRPMKQ